MNLVLRVRALVVALLVILASAPAALAEEKITEFISDVRVQANGDLDVTETIRLESEGVAIQRGIQRDFPTRYRSFQAGLVEVGFTVISVTRNGHAEPFQLMPMANGQRVRIGSADTLIAPGPHTYQLRYRTTRQLAFFQTFDELYWNVTGTGWTFPIEQAEARITLPTAARFGKRAVYTGYQGETGQQALVASEQPGQIVFRTTRRLEANQGLTIAAAWPKGVVAEPPASTRLVWLLRALGPLVLAAAVVLGMLVYMLHGLWRARRDPDPRPVTPLFAPPEDLSAAALRRVWIGAFDDRVFTAAIVDTAVRGRLRIVEKPAKTGFLPGRRDRSLEQTDGAATLPAAEQAMVSELFDDQGSLVLRKDNHEILIKARMALAQALEVTCGGDRYASNAPAKANRGWLVLGGLLLLVAFVSVLANAPRNLPLFLGVTALSVSAELGRRRLARQRKGAAAVTGGQRMFSLLGTGLLIAMICLLCGVLLLFGISSGDPAPMLVALSAIPIVLFVKLYMHGPTAAGWELRSRIAGFRHYLSVAEEDRLERLNPPEKTAALFERYLPYAIALNVETRWAKRFAKVLAAAALDPTRDRGDDWYSGDRRAWSRPGAFAAAVGASLTSTIASAATSPSSSSSSSSSGSSGSGSSGGGGGGGGGSGW